MNQHPHFALWLLVSIGSLGACGGSEADVDEAFRRIQRFEATIAHNQNERAECVDAEPCPARERICEAAAGICHEAAALGDADAAERCELARVQCGDGGS